MRKGQPLFTIYSQELVSTEQEYLLAKQNQQTFATDGHGTAAKERDWLFAAAADRLRQFGVPVSELTRLERTGTVQHDITIESPASGYITEFNALPNQYAQAETKLYIIADPSSVWVYANVYQNEVGQLRAAGTPATVTVDAHPGEKLPWTAEAHSADCVLRDLLLLMVVYLHEALEHRLANGTRLSDADIEQAAIDGAVQRLRPKLMTVTAVILSLAPILWESGIGCDVMRPIAAPIVGGMMTSTIHVLILVLTLG